MMNDITKDVTKAIRTLYRSSPNAQALFDWTAKRIRDASETSIERFCSKLDISRGEAVALARELEEAGCGEFVVGRKGFASRFVWEYSCISLGQAAAGEDATITRPEDPISEVDEDSTGLRNGEASVSTRGMTISEAKAALSLSLGVPPASIEIVVKA